MNALGRKLPLLDGSKGEAKPYPSSSLGAERVKGTCHSVIVDGILLPIVET